MEVRREFADAHDAVTAHNVARGQPTSIKSQALMRALAALSVAPGESPAPMDQTGPITASKAHTASVLSD